MKYLLIALMLTGFARSAAALPIHDAAYAGDLEAVKRLVESGVPVDVVDQKDLNKETPLHMAAKVGHLDVVQYLVDKGANFNATDATGYTVLHNAASSKTGAYETATYLLGLGASPYGLTRSKYTVLHMAVMGGDLRLVQALVESHSLDICSKSQFGESPLAQATRLGAAEIEKYLKEKTPGGCMTPQSLD